MEDADNKELVERKMCPLCSERDNKNEKVAKPCSCQSDSSASSEDSAISSDKVRLKSALPHPITHNVTDLTFRLFEMEQPLVALKVEEELSELELRFLALQSASKIWQQKEQQVMKRSKDRVTKATQEKNGSTPAAAPSRRITTRSISSSFTPTSTPAGERSKTRPKTLERDRTKTTSRPSDRERPKGSSKGLQERARTPGKPHLVKRVLAGKTKIISDRTGREAWRRSQDQEDRNKETSYLPVNITC